MTKPFYEGSKLTLINFAIGLGTFIQVLDSSIANVAIPYIAGNLSVSSDEGTWVITSFAASNAIVLPLTGWLSDYFGRVKLFVWSVLLFAITSFLCGFSTSLTMLILFRILQGAVAGSLIPLSQSLLILNNPPEKQGPALGFWSMIVIVAPVLGPIVGGYLTDVYTWPWIFYINVPIGIFSAAIVWYYLSDRESEIVRNPIDWTGLLLLSIGVGCLQIMLDNGHDLDWFQSNVIIALTLISATSFLYYFVWNHFQEYPIVDFSFFKNRNFLIGTIAITIGYLLFFSSTVTVPLWLQTEQDYTPFWAGVAVAPIGIPAVLLSTTVGRFSNRVDLRYLAALSFVLFAFGYFYQSNFTTEVDLNTIMFARFLQGFGIVVFFLPIIQISLAEIPKSRLASATGLFHFVRILVGSGFGTSLAVQTWTHFEETHHAYLTEYLTHYNPVTTQFYDDFSSQNLNLSEHVINGLLDQQVEKQAFMLALNDLSWLAAWLFLCLVPLIFLCKPPKSAPSTQAAQH